MRQSKITTSKMLSEALSDLNSAHEINRGEETVEVWIAPNGVVHWFANGKPSTEKEAEEIFTRWSVEGL